MAAGDARELSEAQVRDLPEDVARGMRSIVRSFAEAIDEINDRIDRLTGAEGYIPKFDADGGLADSEKVPPGGEIVGDTDEQTLTQKTLTDPTVSDGTLTDPVINNPTITGGTLSAPSISGANLTDPDFTSEDGSFEYAADTADTDISLSFVGTTNNGQYSWMEDEDYFLFADDIAITGGENIILDTSNGTMIGTATAQLLGFWGATPVNQPDTVSDAATQDLTGADTVDKTKTEADLTSCKNAINSVIDRLQELGLIA